MNVKTLFFPLSVTIALFVSIFYIKPEIDVVMADRAAVAEKQDLVAGIDQKVRNIRSLESDLDTHKDDERTVLQYLPNAQDDDHIVDAINFLATQSGLVLTSVKIEKVAAKDAAAAPVTEVSSGSAIALAPSSDSSSLSSIPVQTPLKVFGVTVSAIGSYESARDAVGKLSRMDRFQDFASLKISKADSVTQSGDNADASASPTILNISLTMNFSHLPKISKSENTNLPIFDQNQFDFGVVQRLKAYSSSTVPSLEIGSAGRNNPFLR